MAGDDDDNDENPGGDGVGNDLGDGGFSSAFGEGFNGATRPVPGSLSASVGLTSKARPEGPEEPLVEGGYGAGHFGRGPFGGGATYNESTLGTFAFNEAGPRIVAAPGTIIAGANVSGVGAEETFVKNTRGIITIDGLPAIWTADGENPYLQIDRADQELVAVRTFVLELRARNAADPNAHNNPPELVDDPEIDLEAVDAAIQCLTVLRPLLSQPQPDIELLRLLWRVVVAALRAIERLSAWIGRVTKSAINAFTGTTFGKAYMTALGAGLGTATAAGIVYGISQHGPQGLQAVERILRGVLAVLQHVA